jgi:6,7-dimethyl-8-ribityllumazine synthase
MRTEHTLPPPAKVDSSWKIGIVYSAHYEETMTMVEGAKQYLMENGINQNHISLHRVSGAFEIPLIGAHLAANKKVDGLIALGIIVEGETHHARLVAEECARGVMDVQVRFQTPFAFEVLYVDDLTLAKQRLNKGEDAANVLLHSLAELR